MDEESGPQPHFEEHLTLIPHIAHAVLTTTSHTRPAMYVNTAIRFRDPFVSSKDRAPSLQDYAHSALTPPPEMTGVQSARPSLHAGDYSQQHVDYVNGKPAYRASLAPYQSLETSCEYSRTTGAIPHHNGRTSPPKQALVEPSIDPSQQRRGSQYHNAMATNFLIPRSVNDSGGSLSELAAQVSGTRADN